MSDRFLKICLLCLLFTVSGTIITGVFFKREINTIQVCSVQGVESKGIRADCGYGTKLYPSTTNIKITQGVCLQNDRLTNCNNFKSSFLMGMIAVGTTLSFLFVILVVYDCIWHCVLVLGNSHRTHPEPVQIVVRVGASTNTDSSLIINPEPEPQRLQQDSTPTDIPLREICVSKRESIAVGISSLKSEMVVVTNPETDK